MSSCWMDPQANVLGVVVGGDHCQIQKGSIWRGLRAIASSGHWIVMVVVVAIHTCAMFVPVVVPARI